MESVNYPVSIKGIVYDEGGIWLRKNERQEWELPGGRLEVSEQPEETVVRELKEDLGFEVEAVRPIHVRRYTIKISENAFKDVMVVIYVCRLIRKVGDFEWVGEAGKADFKKFSFSEIEALNMPKFYKDAIRLSHESE